MKNRKEKEENIKVKCEICLDLIEQEGLMPLEKCGHIYHDKCVSAYLRSELKDKKYPLKCPNDKCKKEIVIADLKDLLEDSEVMSYLDYAFKRGLEANPDYSYCPTPDCAYVFIWDKNEEDANDFTCPICEEHYCLNCRCIYHDGKTCKEYQNRGKQLSEKVLIIIIYYN